MQAFFRSVPWQVPVLLFILLGHVISPVLIKHKTGLPSRTRRFSLQFFFCALFSLIVALVAGTFTFDRWVLIIGGLGVANSLASYAQWRAIDISLSKNALFTPADDLIGITLGYVFLHEGRFLTPTRGVGV